MHPLFIASSTNSPVPYVVAVYGLRFSGSKSASPEDLAISIIAVFLLSAESNNPHDAFILSDGKYDYVLNLSALKHVRSEEDPYTLMRMIDINIFNTDKTIMQSIKNSTKNMAISEL